MADYYPLISRAVSGLSDQSPEMRAAVFDRARSALLEQLRSLDPPLAEDDIESEREALDEAIATIEAEYSGTPDDDSELGPEPEPLAAPLAAPGAADDRSSSSLQNGSGRDEWPEADSPSGAPQLAPAWAGSDFPEPAFERDRVRHDAVAEPQEEPLYEQELAERSGDPAIPPQGFKLPGARQSAAPPRRQPVGDRPAERPRPRVDSVAPRTSSGGGFRA
ncbi:MAG TPA: hypothetical protein VLQ65_08570, partial [Saliniramus sp.]|nr:hypothetical protein [Saliniramus sp.]